MSFCPVKIVLISSWGAHGSICDCECVNQSASSELVGVVKRGRAPACSGRHQRCFREYIFGASLPVTRETSCSVVSSFTVYMSSQENEGEKEKVRERMRGVTREMECWGRRLRGWRKRGGERKNGGNWIHQLATGNCSFFGQNSVYVRVNTRYSVRGQFWGGVQTFFYLGKLHLLWPDVQP